MKTKKIKIVKSTDSRVWYAGHVGEVFTVIATETTPADVLFWVREPNIYAALNWVKEQDVEIVN